MNKFRTGKYKNIRNSISNGQWLDHFQKVFESVPDRDDTEIVIPPENPENCHILDQQICAAEVHIVAKQLANNKAVGTDGIPNEVYKNLDVASLEYLKSTKFVTPIISNQKTRPPRRGRGCAEHVFALYAMIAKSLSAKKGKLFALFVDLTQAFDSITHAKLWNRLRALGISENCLSRIQELYAEAKTKIRTNEGFTEYIKILNGVLQGESCSPTLFNMYLDEIANLLKLSGIPGIQMALVEILILMYADDLILVSTTVQGLQDQILVLKNFLEKNNLKVNLTKTKVIVFRKGSKISRNITFLWGSDPIEIVETYTYLGVPFKYNGNFSSAKEHFFKHAKVAQNDIYSMLYKSQTSDLGVIKNMFVTFVNSVLIYCAPIWAVGYFREIELLQTKFLRKICNTTSLVPDYILRLETGSLNIKFNVLKSILCFTRKVLNKNSSSITLQCFEEIKSNVIPKYDWFLKVEYFLKDVGIKYDLRKLTKDDINSNFSKILGECKQNLINKDVESLVNSYAMPHYRHIKLDINVSDFYQFGLKWNVVKLIQNLRTGMPYVCIKGTNLKLKGIWNYWKGSDNSPICDACNLNNEEDIYHVMVECPLYKVYRKQLLPEMVQEATNRKDYITLLFHQKLSYEQYMNIYYFWCGVRKVKNFLNECDCT
ncbi:unnamed protein product [Allacma fusca]|uniref:Reverse transcriptase domain-containing protein n=1 Tax=Allacma fusca TaxID=39272 RepID=A0A8J2PT62_9HEXA|nr:unnamed protein product [Allacma fusca]